MPTSSLWYDTSMERKISFFIPVKKVDGVPCVFLQLRSHNDKQLAGYHSIFGGHAEGNESPEQAMLRESKEELNYTPTDYKFLEEQHGNFDGVKYIKHVYWEMVPDTFDETMIIGEGDGGEWLTEEDVAGLPKLYPADRENLQKLFAVLREGYVG